MDPIDILRAVGVLLMSISYTELCADALFHCNMHASLALFGAVTVSPGASRLHA